MIREAGKRFVVMDTAPTGHTLLLLDATGAYLVKLRKKWAKRSLYYANDATSGSATHQSAAGYAA